jgi:uncharacterized protein
MTKLIALFAFLFISIAAFGQTVYTVETIPDPKQTGGGYVSNPDGVIDASTVQNINAVLAALEDFYYHSSCSCCSEFNWR